MKVQHKCCICISKKLNWFDGVEEYPASIEYLVMHENPCSNAPDFRLRVAFYLPEIEEINELRVTKLERRLSKATFGNM